MRLPWKQQDPPREGRISTGPQGRADIEHASRSIARIVERLERFDKPEILDLGPFCGETVIFLADHGARVSVGEYVPPAAVVPEEQDDAAAPPPLKLDQPDGRFHFVLAWERLDFTPPERLAELGAELTRVLADEGWLLVFAQNRPGNKGPQPSRLRRFRLIGEDRILAQIVEGPARPRWSHPTRDIERALTPLAIQGIHLQRNQTREFLALKKKKKSERRAVS